VLCSFTINGRSFSSEKEYKKLYKKGIEALLNGHYKEGHRILTQALELGRKDWSYDPYDYSEAAYELAFNQYNHQAYEQAIFLYQEALDVWEVKGKKESDKVYYSDGMADCLIETGRFSDAERFLTYCKSYYEQQLPDEPYDFVTTGEKLAKVHTRLGNPEKAISELQSLRALAPGGMDRSRIMQSEAHLHLYLKAYDKAEKLYLDILKDLDDQYYSDNYFHGSAYLDLANFYSMQQAYGQAETYTQKAIDILSSGFSKEGIEHAAALLNLGLIYEKQGLTDSAELKLKEAIKMTEKSLGKAHKDYSVFSSFMAEFYAAHNQPAMAAKYYLESVECLKTAVGPNHPDYARALQDLARMKEKLDEKDQAKLLMEEAMDVWIDQLQVNVTGLSETEFTKFYQSFSENFEVFQAFVLRNHQAYPELVEKMLNLRLATKGVLFRNTQKLETEISESTDKALIKKYAQWKDLKRKIASIYNLSTAERTPLLLDLDAATEQANSLEKELSLKVHRFETPDYAADWNTVKNQLNPDEAAVEIIRLKDQDRQQNNSTVYLALVMRPEWPKPHLVVWENGNELEQKALKVYKNLIQYKLKDTKSYEIFWKPITQELTDVKKAYLSLDGVFHTISLYSLWNAAENRYLFDEVELELVNSPLDILDVSSSVELSKNAVLIGFPSYNAKINSNTKALYSQLSRSIYTDSTSRFVQKNGEITPLPGTKVEIFKVDSLLGNSHHSKKVFMEMEATEQQVKNLRNPQILHLATHGFFLKDQDLQTSANPFGFQESLYQEHPLMRSGILFAGAEYALQEGGDGVLTAYEAQNLYLDGTELVVLSACETGLGNIRNGEGVYGLHRALQTAGARATIMSLWTVSDEATQKLMTLFYQYWIQDQLPKKQAFRKAQHSLRNIYPEPYYWAAFILVGQ